MVTSDEFYPLDSTSDADNRILYKTEPSAQLRAIIKRNIVRGDWRVSTSDLLAEVFLDMAKENSIGLLLECGAHKAEISTAFCERGIGIAVAFEANPYTYHNFTSLAASSGVKVIQKGMGAAAGLMHLNIPLEDGLLTPGNASFLLRQTLGHEDSVCVEVTTVDDVLQELTSDVRIALWIDVEGLALEVLLGAKQSLENGRIELIHLECETEEFWVGQALLPEINDFLKMLGFVPVLRDYQTISQFNVIYLRQALIGPSQLLLQNYWESLFRLPTGRSILKHGMRLKDYLRDLKTYLLRRTGNKGTRWVHHIASILGSKSSNRASSIRAK